MSELLLTLRSHPIGDQYYLVRSKNTFEVDFPEVYIQRKWRYTIVQVSGDICLETSVWRQVSGDKCLETSVWRQVSGDKCLKTSVWRQVSMYIMVFISNKYNIFNVNFQIVFFLFMIYGSVIIMNLIVAIMINQMDYNEAAVVLMKQRIDDVSTQSQMDTLLSKSKLGEHDEADFKVSISVEKEERSVGFSRRFWNWLKLPKHKVIRCDNDESDHLLKGPQVLAMVNKALVSSTLKMILKKQKYLTDLETEVNELQKKGKREVNEILNNQKLNKVCTCPCTCQDSPNQWNGTPRFTFRQSYRQSLLNV